MNSVRSTYRRDSRKQNASTLGFYTADLFVWKLPASSHSYSALPHLCLTLELLCSRLTSRSILSHCICSSLHSHPLYYTEGGANISLKKQKAHLCGYSICHVSIHAITYKEKAKEYYYNSNAGLEEVKGRLLAYCV